MATKKQVVNGLKSVVEQLETLLDSLETMPVFDKDWQKVSNAQHAIYQVASKHTR